MFEFHLTFDFGDDILYAKQEWTEEWLRKVVQACAERGISALHWIDNGEDQWKSLFMQAAQNNFSRHVPNPLKVVADEAHRCGMRCYSVLKYFDFGFGMPWETAPTEDAASGPRGLNFIGGRPVFAHRWLYDHPEMRAELHPALQGAFPRQPVAAIRLWHERARLPHSTFKIYISDNNRDYAPYTGPQKITFSERRRKPPIFVPAPEMAFAPEGTFTCIEISELELHTPFIALEPESHTELANTLSALVEMVDAQGAAVPFTYGLAPVLTATDWHPDWHKAGIAFDAAMTTDIPGRGWTFVKSGGRHRVALQERGFLGLARGRNRFLSGILELAYPQAREWCVQLAERALNAGCDGVDVRLNSHTESLDWENYGFGPPIVDEYQRRHGVDISKERFDRALWRRLRGEYVNQMLSAVGGLVRRQGKRLSIQISDNYERTPEEICHMEIFFDWRKWCEERMMDAATITKFKFAEPFYENAAQLCRSKNIPMVMTPSMFSATDSDWQRDGPIYFQACARGDFEAFNIYEGSAVVRLEKRGLEFLCPSLWRMVKETLRDEA